MLELETSRLKLRQFSWDDFDELARISADPNTRGFLWDGTLDHETTTRNLCQWMKEYERGLGHLAMIHKPDGEFIGHCGLMKREGHVILAYALRKDYWCKGLAPEACRAVLRYGFEELKLEEIWSGTRPENLAWQGMMEKLGMTLRETERTDDGEEVRYSILQEEFFSLPRLPL